MSYNKKVELTEHGRAVAIALAEERKERQEHGIGEPLWYHRYFSPEYLAAHPTASEEHKFDINKFMEKQEKQASKGKKNKKAKSRSREAFEMDYGLEEEDIMPEDEEDDDMADDSDLDEE